MLHSARDATLDKRPGFGRVVQVIFQRIADGLGNDDRASEMDYRFDRMIVENTVDEFLIRDIPDVKRCGTLDRPVEPG